MPRPPKQYIRTIFIGIGIASWALASVAVLTPIFPYFLYRLSPGTPKVLAENLAKTAPSDDNRLTTNDYRLPDLDPSLPTTNRLTIPDIGVDGQIHEGTDWEQILRQGVWIVPDFATPDSGQKPVILASHRWGYLDWSNSFRRLNSFYSLPRLKDDDQVKITWGQREYTYEVYKSETAEAVSDYSADLILYTCELWNSPRRVFRYAKRV